MRPMSVIALWKKMLLETDDGTPPLFKSQRDLARSLCECGNLNPEGTPQFLSNIFKGRNPLPDRWLPIFRVAVERRARERGLGEQEIEYLLRHFAEEPDGPLSELMIAQKFAREVLILNDLPLELCDAKRAHGEAKKLQNFVFTTLERGGQYRYGVGSRQTALRLWDALLRAANETFSGDGEDRMREWAACRSLMITVVPELLLLHPTVAYDASVPDSSRIFIWHAPYDWDHCLELPTRQASLWLNRVQHTLNTQSEDIVLEC